MVLVLNIYFIAVLGLSLILAFFNMCLFYGYLPVSCLEIAISPIIKNTNAKVSDVNNYRSIAVSTIFPKLFEQGRI